VTNNRVANYVHNPMGFTDMWTLWVVQPKVEQTSDATVPIDDESGDSSTWAWATGLLILGALVLWSVLPIILCYRMASKRNRSRAGWAVLGLFIGWIAVAILAISGPAASQGSGRSEDMRGRDSDVQ